MVLLLTYCVLDLNISEHKNDKAATKCWNKQTDNLSDAEELCVLSFKEDKDYGVRWEF